MNDNGGVVPATPWELQRDLADTLEVAVHNVSHHQQVLVFANKPLAVVPRSGNREGYAVIHANGSSTHLERHAQLSIRLLDAKTDNPDDRNKQRIVILETARMS